MQEHENQTGSSAEEPRVRVMSEDEARDYQGVTIEEHKDGSGQRVEAAQDRYGSADGLHGSGIRIHTFGTASSMNWLTKAALVVGGAAGHVKAQQTDHAAGGIGQVVHRVGGDGHRAGEQAGKQLAGKQD